MSSSEKPCTSRLVSSKSVNDKIIEYYLKYAKDRDIEKFMRFSSTHPSRCASSDEYECVIELDVNSGCKLLPKNAPAEEASNKEKTPIVQTELSAQSPLKDVTEPLTAPDSITKNAKKLEWDSLGDVGYKKARSTGNLSSLERSVLRELFNGCPSEPNILRHRSNEATSSSLSITQKARRERWRETLEHLGKKYSSLSASLDTQEFIGQPQSTPKLMPNAEKSCQTTFDKKKRQMETNSKPIDHSCQTSFDQRLSRRSHKSEEKYSQTSVAKIKSQEVQANFSSRADSFATQSSFEYQAGESESSSSLARRSILSERNSAARNSRQSSDSDKENKSVKKPNRQNGEVDLGIKLLCSLIDAKNLSGTQKKKLAKKIFEKITKQQTSASASTSTSLTSRSTEFSVRSLIENSPSREVETNRSEVMPASAVEIIQQVSEETQTDKPKECEKRPSTCSSQEEPVTMREWLHPLTRSEKDYDKKLKKQAAQEVSPQTSERQKQLSWIETEINRLEGLKNLLIQESPSKSRSNSSKSTIQSSGGKAEVIYEETAEDVVNSVEQYKRTTRRTSQNVVIYDEPNANDGKQPEKVEYKSTRVVIDEEQYGTSSSSLKNRRSKLETPASSASPECESVSAFANQLQKQFMESYSKKERCVSEHYSEPRVRPKPIFTRNPSYTSVASSPFCMSSEMSIPIVESSSTSTTTHQYDSHGCDSVEGVAVQTTYSVIKTDPIFGPRCRCICKCGKQCKCSCPRPTVRVSGQAFHQTVQVKPKALAYVIRFSETCDSDGNKVTEESLTLQQCLENQNPNFCSKANERREILKKLHNLRQEREQRIREIAESSSISSISTKLKQLPPPAIKQVRICPTREMKSLTKKRYCKLQEVVAKQEREKLEKRKKTTRMLTHIFNKKLQRMVHKGKMSLEYSRTVI